MLYAGGTMGMKPADEGGRGLMRRLKPGSLDELRAAVPEFANLPFQVDWEEFKHEGRVIDSADANIELYNELTARIGETQDQYDGVVVIFGTDTMGPTAGALSYQLEGLRKPVILTGAMVSVHEPRSDGPKNLGDAIHVAARAGYDLPEVNEVAIAFGGQLWRGVAARKWSVNAFNGIDSPGVEPLADMRGAEIEINPHTQLPSVPPEVEFKTHRLSEEADIAQLTIFPTDDETFEKFVKATFENADAVLIHGVKLNSDSKKLEIIKKYQPEGVPVFYLNEGCPDSSWIEAKGITDFQQAMIKILYVLSRTSDPHKMRELFQANLRGEGEGPLRRETEILRESEAIHEPRGETVGRK